MKIWHDGGELKYELSTFPDGQPHFQLIDVITNCSPITVEAAITNPHDLFDVMMVGEVLQRQTSRLQLDVRYLMGARMDRRIDSNQPFTLKIVADCLHRSYDHIRILDPHSEIACRQLMAEKVMPKRIVNAILALYDPDYTVVIAPDTGAMSRVRELVDCEKWHIRDGIKKRDSQTGQLSGFDLRDKSFVKNKNCLIVDDICDGGGTFSGLSEVLHEAGAQSIDLYVTHGIFSKGLPLKGINRVYTTDSYPGPKFPAMMYPIRMREM